MMGEHNYISTGSHYMYFKVSQNARLQIIKKYACQKIEDNKKFTYIEHEQT